MRHAAPGAALTQGDGPPKDAKSTEKPVPQVEEYVTIGTAEVTYSSTWGTGFSVDLASLGGPSPCVNAAPGAACLIDSLLSQAPFTKSGYLFNAAGTKLVGAIYNGFEVNATPTTYQTTGVRAFCDDQTGVLKFVEHGAASIGIGN